MKKSLPIIIVVILLIGGALFLFLRPEMEEDTLPEDQTGQEEIVQDDQMEESLPNIVGTAMETPFLSTLVTALGAGDLVSALSDESAEFTVFAPTNDAFAQIQETVDTLLLEENKADLQNVLQYHVVSGRVMSTDLSDGMELTALNGETLVITIVEGRVLVNDIEVGMADIETSNGVVHVIEGVLVP